MVVINLRASSTWPTGKLSADRAASMALTTDCSLPSLLSTSPILINDLHKTSGLISFREAKYLLPASTAVSSLPKSIFACFSWGVVFPLHRVLGASLCLVEVTEGDTSEVRLALPFGADEAVLDAGFLTFLPPLTAFSSEDSSATTPKLEASESDEELESSEPLLDFSSSSAILWASSRASCIMACRRVEIGDVKTSFDGVQHEGCRILLDSITSKCTKLLWPQNWKSHPRMQKEL